MVIEAQIRLIWLEFNNCLYEKIKPLHWFLEFIPNFMLVFIYVFEGKRSKPYTIIYIVKEITYTDSTFLN